ncbi:unnamed protein product [Macrosiphum euphorbiae]|uniref:Uncharacterized protein n=1 Tax=Macrosiphum euphorbiae TaxID=13131 RepID=A0AAV0VMY9_9HEMI|nr:unnamed protein product [Macrosiphum euphorbiae]
MSTKQSLKNRKNRKYNKRWVIVSFTESNDYSVVPVNWLILPPTLELTADNISIVELCRWPPFNVTSIELTNADDPEDLWGLFKIKILSSKIYVNFKEAWHQRVEIESSATENEPEVLKKKKKNRQRSSSEDDDSDFEDCSISVTPISKKLKKDVPLTYTELLVRNSDEEFNCELDSVLPPAVEIAASSSVSYIINDDIHTVKNTDEIQLYEPYEPFIVPNTSYSTTSTGSLN